MLHVNLKNTVNDTLVSLPCADGLLPEFLAMTSGNYNDNAGRTWRVTADTQSGNIRRQATCGGITGHFDAFDIERSLEQIGFGSVNNTELIPSDYVTTETAAKPENQQEAYPYIYLWAEKVTDTGTQTNKYTNHFSLKSTSNAAGAAPQSYDGTNSIKVYGGIILLKNTLGVYIFGVYYATVSYLGVVNQTNVDFLCWFNTSMTSENWTEPEYDPGDTGYKPTGSRTKRTNPGVGGNRGKNPEYKSDPITQPGEPDESHASASGSGFITAYEMDTGNLSSVGQCLWSTTLEGFLSGLFVNPLDYIVSLCVFPARPKAGGSTPVKLGRFKCDVSSDPNSLGINAYGSKLTHQFKVFDFGTIEVPENWGSFLDYQYTTIELYLPFIGTVTIDTAEVMGGTINVQYTIDFFTGQCVANVLCTKHTVLPDGQTGLSNVHAQHSYQGNCATQIPLSRVDYGSMVGNLINACTQAITNPVGAAVNIGSDVLTGGMKPNVSSKGNIVANSGFCSVLYPYLRITRPITAEPESFQEVMGYPSYINTTLGQCSGYCKCADIDLSNIHGATEGELNRLKQACMEGVYI